MGAKQNTAPIARAKLEELLEALHGAADFIKAHLAGDATEPYRGNAQPLLLAHDMLRAERHRAANVNHSAEVPA